MSDHLDERLKNLESWQKAVDEDFSKQDRSELKVLATRWRVWRATAVTLASILGIGGSAYFWESVHNVRDEVGSQLDNVKHDTASQLNRVKDEVGSQLSEVKTNVQQKLTELVQGEVWQNKALDVAKHEYERSFERDLTAGTFVNMTTSLSGLTMLLEMEGQRESISRVTVEDPYLIRDTLYAVGELSRDFAPSLAIGNLPIERKHALIFCVNGLTDQAHANFEGAKLWYQNAISIDPTMAQPRILLAWLKIKSLAYKGHGSWSDEKMRSNVCNELREAITLAGGSESFLIVKARIDCLRLSNNFDGAMALAQEEIDREGMKADPRLFFRKGWALWEKSRDQGPDNTNREEAARSMLEAVNRDQSYLRALNNYIWFTTHLNDEKDTQVPLSSTNASDRAEFEARTDVLEAEPIIRHWSSALNTLAEARVALGQPERGLRLAEDALREAILWKREDEKKGDYVQHLRAIVDRIKADLAKRTAALSDTTSKVSAAQDSQKSE